MALDANQKQQQMMELTLLQQMDAFSTSRLDTCTVHVLFKFIFHEIILLFYNY